MNYGTIQDGQLVTSSLLIDGYKPVEYEVVPEFDELTHYITQKPPVDEGNRIFVGIEINQLPIEELEDA